MALTSAHGERNPTIDALSPLLAKIFALLPADQRARAACVCRLWNETLKDPALWLRLDLSISNGMTCTVDDDTLLGAAARACGRLEFLDVTGRNGVEAGTLSDVVRENASTLCELRGLYLNEFLTELNVLSLDEAEPLLAATTALEVVKAHLSYTGSKVRKLVRKEPPFQALQLLSLAWGWDEDEDITEDFPLP